MSEYTEDEHAWSIMGHPFFMDKSVENPSVIISTQKLSFEVKP